MTLALEKLQEFCRQSKQIFVKILVKHPLPGAIAGSILILLICSSLKHALFQSTAFELGIFDQALYAIAQGQPPISSFLGFHILGDHAALILYPLALFYRIYADVHWLFAVQAIALASGAWFVNSLALEAGLKPSQGLLVAIAYLLYPLVFNINLFDFHPDVFIPAGLLAAILAARCQRIGGYIVAIALVLSAKAVVSLTVAAMGIWLFFVERRRLYGAIALFASLTWFIIALQVIIPTFGGDSAEIGRHLWRYAELGDSFSSIARNLLFQPEIVFGKIFSFDTLQYLLLLLFPLLWGLSPRHLTPLIGALPALGLNILADDPHQRDLIHQYSLPILPFLLVAVISTLAAGKGWQVSRRIAILWLAIAFFGFAKHYYFLRYLNTLDTWQATRNAIAMVQPHHRVLTDNQFAPHLTHRPAIELINVRFSTEELDNFDCVLINLRHPWPDNKEQATKLVRYFQSRPQFQLYYQSSGVYLFLRKEPLKS